MKLYTIPKGSRIKASTSNDNGDNLGEYIIFHHLDGAYSYCTVESNEKESCHLSANQELKKTNNYYELI
jgi:hypothetical protein